MLDGVSLHAEETCFAVGCEEWRLVVCCWVFMGIALYLLKILTQEVVCVGRVMHACMAGTTIV